MLKFKWFYATLNDIYSWQFSEDVEGLFFISEADFESLLLLCILCNMHSVKREWTFNILNILLLLYYTIIKWCLQSHFKNISYRVIEIQYTVKFKEYDRYTNELNSAVLIKN